MTIMTDPATGGIQDPRDALGSLSELIHREPPGTYYAQAAFTAVMRLWEAWTDQRVIEKSTVVYVGDIVIDGNIEPGPYAAWYVASRKSLDRFVIRRLIDGVERETEPVGGGWQRCQHLPASELGSVTR